MWQAGWGKRGERGLPPWLSRLPSQFARLAALIYAERRRALGFYDHRTLALYIRSLRIDKGQAILRNKNFLGYLLFRRDLGYTLNAPRLSAVESVLPRLKGKRRRQAMDLLIESADCRPSNLPRADLQEALTIIRRQQAVWRAAFRQTLLEQRRNGICVVGNAGMLLHAALGHTIDSYGCVIRFNQYQGSDSRDSDIGQRLHVWVCSPGYRKPPPHDAHWVVVTGPQMEYRMLDWSRFEAVVKAERAILTVPLGVWRHLVALIQAPPSAGILVLAWLRELLGSWEGIAAAGIGQGSHLTLTENRPYHQADHKHKATSRHDWSAENQLFHSWLAAGLTRIG